MQFHPTGMVWPPSVRGILVTEGVRGEGGVLRNNTGDRFMFGDIPENYTPADRRERRGRLPVRPGREVPGEGLDRPPELLTRDHVARCIVREVREGRGSPHGGVFLELQTFAEWFGKHGKKFNATEHWKKKLPSMYHQFKELGGLDITKEAMEVGPTTHYMMGGVRVDSDTQMSRIPGLFACGECAAGINGANRLGGNSLSDLLVLGKRAGEFAAQYAKENAAGGTIHADQVDAAAKWALEPFDRADVGESVQDSREPAGHDARPRRHRAQGRRDGSRARRTGDAPRRAAKVQVTGNREFNPGWHTAMDLHNLLTVSEAVTLAAIQRKESRGAQFRDDYPKKDNANFGKVNSIIAKGADGSMQIRLEQLPPMPQELKDAILAEAGGVLPDELK